MARRRAVDMIRRDRQRQEKYAQLGRDMQADADQSDAYLDRVTSEDIEDELLRLVFSSALL